MPSLAAASIVPRRRAAPLRRLVILIINFALTACAVTGDTGAPEWLAIDSAPTPDGCPNLAGQYENRASAVHPGSTVEPVSLTDIFGAMAYRVAAADAARSWSVPADATHVSIEQGPEDLTITFAGQAGEQTSQNFRRLKITRRESHYDDLFACNSSRGTARLSFPMVTVEHWSFSAAPVYIGGGDVHVQFFKARDGALIMRTVTNKAGLSAFIIGTHFSRDSSWSRFAPVEGSR